MQIEEERRLGLCCVVAFEHAERQLRQVVAGHVIVGARIGTDAGHDLPDVEALIQVVVLLHRAVSVSAHRAHARALEQLGKEQRLFAIAREKVAVPLQGRGVLARKQRAHAFCGVAGDRVGAPVAHAFRFELGQIRRDLPRITRPRHVRAQAVDQDHQHIERRLLRSSGIRGCRGLTRRSRRKRARSGKRRGRRWVRGHWLRPSAAARNHQSQKQRRDLRSKTQAHSIRVAVPRGQVRGICCVPALEARP